MRICLPAAYSAVNPRRSVLAASSPLLFALLLLSLATCCLTPVAYAQRIRPAFEPKLVRRMTVSGTVQFRVVPRRDGLPHEFAPIGSGGWVAAVRIDGHLIASLSQLPATVAWDTRAAGDGIHEVLVTVRNARSDQEVGVEGAQVIVDNAAADTAADATATMPSLSTDATPRLVLTVPEAAKVTTVTARFSQSHDLLSARATALLRSGSRLYLGLSDGGIAFCEPDASSMRAGSVVRLPVGEGAVRSLAVCSGRVWWTTEEGRAVYAYSDAIHTVTRYAVTGTLAVPPPPPVVPDPSVTVPESTTQATTEPTTTPPPDMPPATAPVILPTVPPKPTGWVRRIAVLRGQVLLLGDAGNIRVLDPRSGALTDAVASTQYNGLLPTMTLEGGDESQTAVGHLYIASAGDDSNAPALVVSVTPTPPPAPETTETMTLVGNKKDNSRWRRYQLRAWRCGRDGVWKTVASFATDANPERGERLALSPDALATTEREGPRLISTNSAEPSDLPYALSPGMPSSTDRVVIGTSGLWWEQRGIVFRADPRTGARDAYLPWNVAGETGAVLALATDGDSVWVATTSAGIRRIRPGRHRAGRLQWLRSCPPWLRYAPPAHTPRQLHRLCD